MLKCNYFTSMLCLSSVIGCKDPPLDGATLLHRTETTATLKCNRTGEQWQIVCKNGAWSGPKTNCSLHGQFIGFIIFHAKGMLYQT